MYESFRNIKTEYEHYDSCQRSNDYVPHTITHHNKNNVIFYEETSSNAGKIYC